MESAEAGDAESAPTPAAPARGTATTMGAVASLSLAAVPLTGLEFPLAGTPLALVPANAMGWHRLAEQFFQALARTASSLNDPMVVGLAQNLEHALGWQLFLVQASWNEDGFNCNAMSSDLAWQETSRQPGRPTREPDESSSHLLTPDAETETTRAALDHLYSQDAADTDLAQEDE